MREDIWIKNNLSPHFRQWYKRRKILEFAIVGTGFLIAMSLFMVISVFCFFELDLHALLVSAVGTIPCAVLLLYIRLKKLKWNAAYKIKITNEGVWCEYDDGSRNIIRWGDIVGITLHTPSYRKEDGDEDVEIFYQKWYRSVVVSKEIGKEIIEQWLRYKGLRRDYEQKNCNIRGRSM